MNTKQQPEAQERKFWKRLCALNRFSFFYMGGGVARASDKSGNWIEVHSAQEIVDDAECEVSALTARITELESQLAQRFDAADVATAAAQGFRDGAASLAANAGGPRNAIERDALIDAIAQGLHGTRHCTRVWQAWHVGTMSQDDFEPVDESETPTEIADAVLALLAAPPTAQAEGWTTLPGQMPEPNTPVLLDIGKKFPIRALWAEKHTVCVGPDVDDWGEYDEETDEYYCPEGWYEWNEHEDTHWRVTETPRAWMPLPPTSSADSRKGE